MYDIVLHSWIKRCVDWFGVANNIIGTLEKSMKTWKVKLTSGGESLGELKIRMGIFEGDSISPLLFVLALIPKSMVLNTTRTGYQLVKNRGRIFVHR